MVGPRRRSNVKRPGEAAALYLQVRQLCSQISRGTWRLEEIVWKEVTLTWRHRWTLRLRLSLEAILSESV